MLVLSKAERALIYKARLEAELASHKGHGALPRDKMLEAAARLFSAFDSELSLAHLSTAALVAELKRRKAAAEAEAAD